MSILSPGTDPVSDTSSTSLPSSSFSSSSPPSSSSSFTSTWSSAASQSDSSTATGISASQSQSSTDVISSTVFGSSVSQDVTTRLHSTDGASTANDGTTTTTAVQDASTTFLDGTTSTSPQVLTTTTSTVESTSHLTESSTKLDQSTLYHQSSTYKSSVSDVTFTTSGEGTTGSNGLSQAEIIGISVGVSVGVILVIVLVAVYLWRRSNSRRKPYLDDGDNPNDYRIDTQSGTAQSRNSRASVPNKRQTRPPSSTSTRPQSRPNSSGIDPNSIQLNAQGSHYAVTGGPAFNNPMYAEGLNLEHPELKEEEDFGGVKRRPESLTREERALQARSRYSMGPILLGNSDGDISSEATYSQMYGTTGTFTN